jgi:hypothetical protein
MPQQNVKSETIPASTILATSSVIVEAPYNGVVVSVTYTPVAAVTGAASPASRTLSLINRKQDGTGAVVVASLALVSGVNLVAFDEKALTNSVTASDLVVAAGDELEFRSAAVGGTGLVDPGGKIDVTFGRND